MFCSTFYLRKNPDPRVRVFQLVRNHYRTFRFPLKSGECVSVECHVLLSCSLSLIVKLVVSALAHLVYVVEYEL